MSLSPAAALGTRLHTVEAGAGPTIVCLHSSGSSSGQWRRLIESWQFRYRFVAVDFLGHGRSPEQPEEFDLAAESAAVWEVVQSAREPIHLVGHSYGGAVAIDLALRHPERVASLTVYEPVLFSLLDPASAEFDAITSAGWGIVGNARAGALEAAAASFIDYWSGVGSWGRLPVEHQARALARIMPVARHFEALFASELTLDRLGALHVPTRVLCGDRSPAPARAVSRRVASLACATMERLSGLGHMGPVTHPERVNPLIAAHLESQALIGMAA